MGKGKSRAQRFAEANALALKGLDPEADTPAQDSDEESGSASSDDDLAGTEHYVEVGKSRLRKQEEIALGPKYAGSRISREALFDDDNNEGSGSAEEQSEGDGDGLATEKFADPNNSDLEVDSEDEEIDSDVALGESDSEKFKAFAFRGSSKPAVPLNKGRKKRPTAADFMSNGKDEEVNDDKYGLDEDILGTNQQHDEDMEDASLNEEWPEDESEDGSAGDGNDEGGEEDKSDKGFENEDSESGKRTELRKIMNEEERTVVATISQAAKADADKGNAVKHQRRTFDSLLSTRMVLQKGLIAVNTLGAAEDKSEEEPREEVYQAAEDAAIKLWNTLDSMRQNLIKTTNDAKSGQKRKCGIDSSTPSSKIWERMKDLEVSSIDSRENTLEKWWIKARGSAAPFSGKLNNVTPITFASVIQDQLAKSEPFEKIKRPRSCAPVQERLNILTDPNIYDDTTLYKTFLNQLVEQRKLDSGTIATGANVPAQWAVKEAKMRKVVDRKASKGRKLRFTVHEKLQNFMAPEDRCSWEPRAMDRFFGTLLGQKMTLQEDELDDLGEESMEEQGLRLFR